MGGFEVQCVVGKDHFCLEVPTDCSVGDVLNNASEYSGVKDKGVSLWYSEVELHCDHVFADYYEPDGVYQVRVGGNIKEGTLLKSSESKVRSLGVNLTAPQLLMEMEGLEWNMDEFWKKAGDFAPTLVLIKMKNGTECGGVAGVPWPKRREKAADPAKGSFIFSLGATPARFDLISPENALSCTSWSFGFGDPPFDSLFDPSSGACDLSVCDDGGCWADGQGAYAGPREEGQLIAGSVGTYKEPYERWELWRL
jgi:hypothetical protein